MLPTRSSYSGTEKKLVLAFDIGTTFSGISYCLLKPGYVPEICRVTRFPAQRSGGDSKIPTILYYDRAGRVRSCGAEATQPSIREQVIKEDWVLAEWFNLHMRPQSISNANINRELPKLPLGKSVVDVFADFLHYLYGCTKTFIQETHVNGASLWQSVEAKIDYVLSHPGGWEGSQQEQMRRAAVKAGLITEPHLSHARIRFVTEGEASLRFCIQKGLTIQNGDGIIIVDVGEETIDISAHRRSAGSTFEEIAAPRCYLQGSAFVTSRARGYLNEYLRESRFYDNINDMVSGFDQSAKFTFESEATPVYIRFGRPRDMDPKVNIRAGQLCLPGAEVAKFFQPSIDCIINAVIGMRKKTAQRISTVLLVGVFSANRYLFAQIKSASALADLDVCRPDCHLNNAIAGGAIFFYLDGSSKSDVYISKFAYGIRHSVVYDQHLQLHREQRSKVSTDIELGAQGFPYYFDTILPKGTQVSETMEFRRSYQRIGTQIDELKYVIIHIIVYSGSSVPGQMDIEKDRYSTLCYVEADTSQLCRTLIPKYHNGRAFYEMNCDIVLSFGLTQVKAQIAWKENGVEKRGPATVASHAI